MNKSRQLASALKVISKNLKLAAVWNTSKDAVDGYSSDYLYENLCLLSAAAAVKGAFTLSLDGKVVVDVKGRTIALWPKKPGHKTNFSYFVLSASHAHVESFQLCPGIRVTDIHGKDRAPDVNLLEGDAPDVPSHFHLKACWDAKYSTNETRRLPDNEVSDFIHTFRQLGAPVAPGSWKAAVTVPAFAVSGLVTNGAWSTEPDATLAASGLTETAEFPDRAKTRP
jgi:hypothetical protein